MFHQLLKETTAQSHLALEKKLLASIRDITTPSHYVALLHRMYGFYAPLEHTLGHFLGKGAVPDYGERRKASWILSDIRTISKLPPLRVCTDLPAIQTYHAALGAMYVLEGATLGGKIIAGMIARQLNSGTESGYSFFLSYGEQRQQMWRTFLSKLQSPFAACEQKEILHTAEETFVKFKKWIDNYAAQLL